jgi:multidrug efflux pump subunit AcrA (membrane-fusion protein)
MGQTTHSSYVIVPRAPDRRPVLRVAMLLGWVLSLALAWMAASWYVAPKLPGLSASLETTRAQLQQAQAKLRGLDQRQATLERSDQISRAANHQVQQELAERDQQIADLKANLAFYERLAGATRKPKGLSVHSAEFVPETAGTWHYELMLTQSLNRGAVSAGQLRFVVEGVKDGKLATVDWNRLHQRDDAPAQAYSFRYFQQLRGSVMLPEGFVPQRVRVSLRGENASLDQAVAWVQPSGTGDT